MTNIFFKTTLVLSVLVTGSFASAQRTVLPKGPPEEKIDPGLVQKHSEALMKACRTSTESDLRKQNVAASKIEGRARDICFCIAKDIKRRDDPREMELITKYISSSKQTRTEIDEKINDEQAIWLHEFDKLEQNCRKNPKYRFGMPEPRLPSGSVIDQSLTPKSSEVRLQKGPSHAVQKKSDSSQK